MFLINSFNQNRIGQIANKFIETMEKAHFPIKQLSFINKRTYLCKELKGECCEKNCFQNPGLPSEPL